MNSLSILSDCVMLTFDEEVMRQCASFSCGDDDLNGFFMQKKCWVRHIVGLQKKSLIE